MYYMKLWALDLIQLYSKNKFNQIFKIAKLDTNFFNKKKRGKNKKNKRKYAKKE